MPSTPTRRPAALPRSARSTGRLLAALATTGALWLAPQTPLAAAPRMITTRHATDDVVLAAHTVAAFDGKADATGAIQKAIDAAAADGGGVVFLPVGRYRLDGRLIVKEGVTLRGDWARPPETAPNGTTILMPTAGRGKADGPAAITLQRGSGLREVTIWYPDQKADAIVPYPWTIRTSAAVGGDNVTVMNATLINPYQAIRIGPEGNELHTIRNVYGTPLKTGIWIDMTTDIGRLIDVHFSADYWGHCGLPNAPGGEARREALRQFLLREGVGLEMRRSDWEYVYRVRIEGYGTGAVARPGRRGTANAVLFGCELIGCETALRLEGLNPIGLSATGCTLAGRTHGVHGPASFRTIAQFNTCKISGGKCVLLEGPATLTFQNCTFPAAAGAVVEAQRGSVSLLGCRFGRGGRHVRLGEGVRRARLLANTFDAAPRIVNDSAGDVMISHHRLNFDRPSIKPHKPAPHPRPARRDLFVVADYGAAANRKDNTAAFQKALDAAGAAGGGTVYVPAGYYRFAGRLTVPTGVELRGCFDVPHHTVSGGSVLMPTADRGKADATPFVRLRPRSGLRGLTIWHPEQNLADVKPYPWAVRSMGAGCWLIDVTLGNAYQGADFWTHPSGGHVIRYLAGAPLKRGLFVSKSDGDGWVEDVQFNPHYALRLPGDLPQPGGYPGNVGGRLIDYMRQHLEGIVFGRCADEHVRGTFLYAAHDGLAFRDDGGGANARVIEHGTDTGSRCVVLEAAGPKGIDFINAQLVPLGKWEKGAIISTDSFAGVARFFNTQIWAGNTSGILAGSGRVLLQQLNTLSGGFTVKSGRCDIENAHFARGLEPHIDVTAGCRSARLLANITKAGRLNVRNAAGQRCTARASSLGAAPPSGPATFRTGWEPGQPRGKADTILSPGGGRLSVSRPLCRATQTADARTGKWALRLAGNADGAGHSYVYFRVLSGPFVVHSDSELSYWVRPGNDRGRCVGVDLLFARGATLRDSTARTDAGRPTHPAQPRGQVGKWTQVRIRLGRYHAGKTIRAVAVAYDGRADGPFEALIDDVALTSRQGGRAATVSISPKPGPHPAGTRVTLAAPGAAAIHYTLDGTNPTADSPKYAKPIVLDKPGLWEIRCAPESADGRVSAYPAAALYDVVKPNRDQ